MNQLFNFNYIVLFFLTALPLIYFKFRITNPYVIISFFLFITFVCKIFWNTLFRVDFLFNIPLSELFDAIHNLNIYLFVGFATSFFAFLTFRHFGKTNYNPRSLNTAGFAIPIAIILPILFLALAFILGINPIAQPYQFRTLLQKQGMLYPFSLQIFLIFLILIYTAYKKINQKHKIPSILFVAFLISCIFSILSGYGALLPLAIIYSLFFLNLTLNKRVEVLILIVAPISLLFLIFHNYYRMANLEGQNISIKDGIDIVVNNLDLIGIVFNRLDFLEVFTLGQNLIKSISPDLGSSLISAFAQPIPRAIWPEKPLVTSAFFTSELLPENLEIGVTANFNSLNEFSRAFGTLAPVVGGIIFGVILGYTYHKYKLAINHPFSSTKYLLVFLPYLLNGFIVGFFNDSPLFLAILNYIYFRIFIRETQFGGPPSTLWKI